MRWNRYDVCTMFGCLFSSRSAAVLAVGVAMHLVPQTRAQTPLAREFAAVSDVAGHTNDATYETTIAVGSNRVVTVFHVLPPVGKQKIGFSVATKSGGTWDWSEEGIIDKNAFNNVGLTDPAVAYNRVTGDFLACAMTRDKKKILVARYDSQAQPPDFGDWEIVATGTSFDKPWIVAGEIFAFLSSQGFGPGIPEIQFQEFYITWKGPGVLKYLRSMDNGQNWVGGDALTDLDDPTSVISPAGLPAPRVHNDRPLYVTYTVGTSTLEFVRGDDIDSGPHAGEVQFTRLADTGGQPVTVDRNLAGTDLFVVAPPFEINSGPRGPGYDLATDPTDGRRLYLVYNDTAIPIIDPNCDPNTASCIQDTDVNVYLRVLTRSAGVWSVGPRLPIVDETVTQFESDQFLPAIDVDDAGVLHVIFYDDRKFTDPDPNDPVQEDQQPDSTLQPRYDVFYARSVDQGLTWITRELCDDPGNNCVDTQPAVNFQDPATNFALRDYIGIEVGADRVWTNFMGTSLDDTNPNKSVIWSTQIIQP